MSSYLDMDASKRAQEQELVAADYKHFKAAGLALDMARGKPSAEQLDLSTPLLSILNTADDCFSEDGTDCRNYGVLEGIPEARRLMATMLDDKPENTIVLGNSSLTIMHDAIARMLDFGCLGSAPWNTLDQVKWLCPVPGYDRHFAIMEQFGIEMIPVNLTSNGPDMDYVESLVRQDATIKGIWCVPKYSNPTGITYSDDAVHRLATMECAADDFRIMWDNAYCVHHLNADTTMQDTVLDIGIACQQAGNPDRYLKFASTSKITFPGAGIAAMAASPANISEALKLVSTQMIGADKLTQLRHARFLPNKAALASHMEKHAEILRPRFDLVISKLKAGLDGLDIATWSHPRGGYFVSFDGLKNTAQRTIELAREAGVKLTNAGATWPYGIDPHDSNIRIAPTMPTLDDLSKALDVFICCVKLAALEALNNTAQ